MILGLCGIIGDFVGNFRQLCFLSSTYFLKSPNKSKIR